MKKVISFLKNLKLLFLIVFCLGFFTTGIENIFAAVPSPNCVVVKINNNTEFRIHCYGLTVYTETYNESIGEWHERTLPSYGGPTWGCGVWAAGYGTFYDVVSSPGTYCYNVKYVRIAPNCAGILEYSAPVQYCATIDPPINGACGDAARAYTYDTTSYGSYVQCASGTSSNTAFPAVGSSVSWVCTGDNGGSTSATCTASRAATPVDGQCGTANNKTYAYDVTNYGSDTQCDSGTSSNTAFPEQGNITTWTCGGTNGGLNRDCAAGREPAPVDGQCGTANNKIYTYDITEYGADTQCTYGTPSNTTFPGIKSTTSWTCSGLNGGSASATCTASRLAFDIDGQCGTANNKIYAYDASEYGTDTHCTYGTPSNTAFPETGSFVSWTCSGINGGATSSTCVASKANFGVSQLKNAFDLLPIDNTDPNQCLWCEWYEKSNLISGVNQLGVGKAGSLGFSFYYQDNINYRLSTVSLLVNTTNSTTGGVEITVPRNSDPANTILFGESMAPYVKVDNTVSTLTLDSANNTIKIPYNGGTYYWFVKVTNTNGDDSGWVSATGKQITTPDHKWPTVKIQTVNPTIVINENNQFCSTSSFSSTDPCYSTCYKGTGTPTMSDLADKDKWKCSVCYSTDGSPILCQDKTEAGFSWEDGNTMTFPDSTSSPSWWQYPGDNGRLAMNPVIKPQSLYSKLNLVITGSDCPFGGSISGGKINPTWIEK
ncbi:hypothetical protein M0R01_01325 [bacterium]|nr:hypothetical protein [bacterium]